MKRLLRLLRWILKAAVFFTLFAFALNNQQETRVNFFFGNFWSAPTVVVVLLAFALGLVLGVMVMTPRWWRERQALNPAVPPTEVSAATEVQRGI
jgi:uncharacterized integral membrane protein